MARLSSSPSGATLLPPAPRKAIVRRRAAPAKPLPLVDEPAPTHCVDCGGQMLLPIQLFRRKGEPARWEHRCSDCGRMFGNLVHGGCTNASPRDAAERLAAVQDQGFIIILRELSLGAPDGGVLLIEPGDIFPVRYAVPAQGDGECSEERTWRMFTLPLQVGAYQTKLFPHEFDAIRIDRVMAMKRVGEIQETFVSQDDDVGHFTPRPDLAEAIKAMFGRLVC